MHSSKPGNDTLRVYQRREALPAEPDPGTYVVIDVMYFSTTLIELLAGGASYVHVPSRDADPAAFRAEHPRARIGDEGLDLSTPRPEYDFFNSPTSASNVNLDGRPASLSSFNGARTVRDLRERGIEDIYIGSTTNAAALGRQLRDRDGSLYLVCAGSQGSVALEDLVGALLIVRYYRADEPSLAELAHYHDLLLEARRPLSALPEIRRQDLATHVTAIDSESVLPRLDGDRFVDVESTDDAVTVSPASGPTVSRT